MPVFSYKAHGASGRVINGTLTADTPGAARETLRAQGARLLEFSEVRFGDRVFLSGLTSRAKRKEEVSQFARQLSLLLRSGVTLVEALDVLVRQQQGRFVPIVRDVRSRVAAGSSLGEALGAHPRWFDQVFRAAVEVGQVSGSMDKSLEELACYIRERQTNQTRLLNALTYPMILAVVGTGVVLFLMSYVIPQLLTVLEASGRPLPMSTLLLKNMSDFLLNHYVLLACVVLGVTASAWSYHRWPPGRRRCQALLLRLPLAGILSRKSLIGQFAQMMSLLLRSGVTFVEALELVRRNLTNLILATELEDMERAIKAGSDIAPTLARSRVFPPVVVHILRVGQETGELPVMLENLEEGYRTEVQLAISKFTSALEPLMIVVMAGAVGYVVFATMMPILEATRTIT